ncbi:MAG: ABC transporter permease [Planctomycetota bacterium]|nr:ABC transporter permease [Planctomycetota bacterium]
MRRTQELWSELLVPGIFLCITIAAIAIGEIPIHAVTSDALERVFRNLVLVLSLMIPIVAGLGLNFGIVLGAMAGQMGLLYVENGEIGGLGGICVAVACSIPIAMLLGYLTGLLFNRARGKEMVTGLILGFFANGFYQLLFLILAGPVIPINHPRMLLPEGIGLRVTVELRSVERGLDSPLEAVGGGFSGSVPLDIGGRFWGEIPLLTLFVLVVICLGLWFFFRTKLGQDIRAVGQDPHVAEIAGIRVDRCRIIAIMLSMVLAGIGQIIWLQNMTVMNTFGSHEQVGFYAIAAILVGGATVTRVRIWNAIAGTILFHTMLVAVSTAMMRVEVTQLGEYFRQFFLFAIIGVTLAIYSWKSKKAGEKLIQ